LAAEESRIDRQKIVGIESVFTREHRLISLVRSAKVKEGNDY
jgi:hypothetical protein